MTLRTHRFRAAVNPICRLTLTSESGRLSPVAPRTRSDERTLVVVVAGRSANSDRDYPNMGHRLRIWMHDGEKERQALIGSIQYELFACEALVSAYTDYIEINLHH